MSTFVFSISLIVLMLSIIVCAVMLFKNRPNKTIPFEEHGTEKFYVSESRVTMFSFAFGLIGSLLFLLAGLGLPIIEGFAIIPFLIFIGAAVYLFYIAIVFYKKRSLIIQLKLTPEGIYHKPIKWYSHSRGGSLNAMSVYFSSEWCFTTYKDLSYVSLRESTWVGDSIYIAPMSGKPIKLLLIIDDNALIKEIYMKIHQKINKISQDQNFEVNGFR